MLLAPSEIHFLHDDSGSACSLPPDVVDELGQRLEENRGRVPRIQVVEKDGSWFALNDSYLRIYRELERQGRCPRVDVAVVSLSKVPQDLQKGMTVTTSSSAAATAGAGSESKRVEEQLGTTSDAVGASSATSTTPQATVEAEQPAKAAATGRRRAGNHGTQDASCEAGSAPVPRRCFLKSRSAGGGSSGAGAGLHGVRTGAVPRPAGSAECVGTVSSSDDDDEDEEYDDEYEDEEEVEAADGGDEEEEEEEDEESLTCNVCERSFSSGKRLSQHQQRKRHFGCPVCDALFPSLLALEHHRESLDHWSDDEERDPPQRSRVAAKRPQQRGGRGGDDFDDEDDLDDEEDESSSEEETESDSDGLEPGPKSQELERLL